MLSLRSTPDIGHHAAVPGEMLLDDVGLTFAGEPETMVF